MLAASVCSMPSDGECVGIKQYQYAYQNINRRQKVKKRLIAAALAAQGLSVAHAQSHVQLYGLLDAGLTYVNNQGSSPNIMEDTGIMQGNRWGLRGSEDLGGGLKAVFRLENGFDLNSGKLGQGGREFGRQAYVGLNSASFGQITFGRQYDFMHDDLIVNTAVVQATTAYGYHFLDADRVAGERLDNTVKYLTPNLAGLRLGALYGFSNVAGSFGGTAGAPRAISFGASYKHGPLALGAAYTNVDGLSGSLVSIAPAFDALLLTDYRPCLARQARLSLAT